MSIELIIATFNGDQNAAGETLKTVKKLAKEGALALEDAAVIVKKEDGEVEAVDIGDVDSKHGAVFGAISGGIIGLLGGPVGAVIGAAAGAATGGVTAKLADYGVSEDLIKSIEKGMEPDSSAIIAYVKMNWAARAVAELEKAGADVFNQTLDQGPINNLYMDTQRQ